MSNFLNQNAINTLLSLQNRGYITRKKVFERDTYRLKRPIKITIRKSVLDSLAAVYNASYEKGGVLVLVPTIQNELVCTSFIEVPNTSKNAVSYNPPEALLYKTVNDVLLSNALPIVIHTHPTKIGVHSYDTKNQSFYLRASKPDKIISNEGFDVLEMPEAIFVKDDRFGSGYDIALFSGTIFPQSISSLSDLQLSLLGVGVIGGLFNSLSRKILLGVAALFAFDFVRRPKCTYLQNGDLEITLTA